MKRILSIVLALSLVLCLFSFNAFASETDIEGQTSANTITTGLEFIEKVKANLGGTFYIEGAEILADGSYGISLADPDVDYNPSAGNSMDYAPISGFYGKLIGVGNANNIEVKRVIFISVGSSSSSADILFKNLVLKGTEKINYSGNVNGGAVLAGIRAGTAKITFEGIENHADIESNAKYGVGGIFGFSSGAAVTEFINCANYGDITATATTASAGGIIGECRTSGSLITISASKNEGDISSVYMSAGILGRRQNANTTGDIITGCANYGDIDANTTSTAASGAGGIGGTYTIVEKSFNAGNITSTTAAGGIVSGFGVNTYSVKDCFNVGSVASSATATFNVGGIVGGNSSTAYVVTNCYNAADSITGGAYARDIGYAKFDGTKSWVNNYRIYAIEDEENSLAWDGDFISLEEFAKALPASFTAYEYVETNEDNKYSLPQIKGNTFTTTAETWYVSGEGAGDEEGGEETFEVTFTPGTNAFSSATADPGFVALDEEGNPITTAYSMVASRFVLPANVGIADVEYGMLISKVASDENLTAETCTAEAKGLRYVETNDVFAYGILFYGEMVAGDTYYVRPYVKYNDVYAYGAGSEFIFPALTTAE